MTDLPPPKLIIFDCDGTLVDTEVLHAEIFYNQLQDYKIQISFDEVFDLTSAKSMRYAFQVMRKLYPNYNDTDELTYMANFKSALIQKSSTIAVDGAFQTFVKTYNQLPSAIATNGEVELTELKLKACGYFNTFPDLKFYTKDLVTNPKPAPDLFLYVAKEFDVEPSDCWVIEDSPTGVTAAISAGMTCIGFVGCSHDKIKAIKDLKNAGAHIVIDDYKDFPY